MGCFLIYCDKDSQIRKKSTSCPTTTTPAETTPIIDVTTTPAKKTPSIDPTTTPAEKTPIIDPTTTPAEKTPSIDPTTTPEVTTTPVPEDKYCVYKHFQYTQGQIIGTVITEGTCYLIYCDDNFTISKKTVECTTTAPETTTPGPVVS